MFEQNLLEHVLKQTCVLKQNVLQYVFEHSLFERVLKQILPEHMLEQILL